MTKSTFRQTTLMLLFAAAATTVTAQAAQAKGTPEATAARADIAKTLGFVPQFLGGMPDLALPGLWEEMKTLQLNPATALDGKTKELIGLGVAAQVPCRYCIYAHTEFAKLNGASEAEVGEAVAMAALTRHWSTVLNGMQTDEAKFRGEIATILDNVKKAAAGHGPAPQPVNVVDGASALKEATQMLGGYAPEFIAKFPAEARAGAWREFRDVQLNPKSALPGKSKELVGLAVAAQIPCRFCVIAHTEFAKLNGASEREINEAIAMGALTRNLSTMVNGLQVDESGFRKDIAKVVAGARAAQTKKTRTTAAR
jgi:AhpD family alkylhydroperoxidase